MDLPHPTPVDVQADSKKGLSLQAGSHPPGAWAHSVSITSVAEGLQLASDVDHPSRDHPFVLCGSPRAEEKMLSTNAAILAVGWVKLTPTPAVVLARALDQQRVDQILAYHSSVPSATGAAALDTVYLPSNLGTCTSAERSGSATVVMLAQTNSFDVMPANPDRTGGRMRVLVPFAFLIKFGMCCFMAGLIVGIYIFATS